MADTRLFPEDGLFHRTAKASAKAFYRLLWRCLWLHPERVPAEGPVLLVANHPSYLDPLCVYAGAPRRIHWMAWDNLFTIPWMGPFIRRAGAFPVNDLAADVASLRTATRLLREGKVVGVFPEAGRSLPGGRMFPFLAGPFRLAVRCGCPIVPVTVNGSGRIWPRGQVLPGLGSGIEVVFHRPILPDPDLPAGGRPGAGAFGAPGRAPGETAHPSAAARAEALARRARRAILSAYRAPLGALERSARPEVVEPAGHPILRADREGSPLLEWIRRNPRWEEEGGMGNAEGGTRNAE